MTNVKNKKATDNKQQQINHPIISPEPTPVIDETDIPIQIGSHIEKNVRYELSRIEYFKSVYLYRIIFKSMKLM